ncbi:MAG: hypothetical protein LBH02_02035 [Methanocalculaceae archaeon]|nr:hypothetical protein [Methanocalculaceae archaeon]
MRIRSLSREKSVIDTICEFVSPELIRAAGADSISLCGRTNILFFRT